MFCYILQYIAFYCNCLLYLTKVKIKWKKENR